MMKSDTKEKPRLVRLQKFLSRCGVSSRRGGEELMRAGRVRVNGEVADRPGKKIDPARDRVTVDGKAVLPSEKIYIMLNKPAGYLCSLKDRFSRPLVTELLTGLDKRVYHIGRLDLDSEGLLLLTNDGEFSQMITHPSFKLEKKYRVRLRDPLEKPSKLKLEQGVGIGPGEVTVPARVRVARSDPRRVEITIREGKKRQVKRMFKAVGNRVLYLERIAVGPLGLGKLRRGGWRKLSNNEVAALRRTAGAT